MVRRKLLEKGRQVGSSLAGTISGGKRLLEKGRQRPYRDQESARLDRARIEAIEEARKEAREEYIKEYRKEIKEAERERIDRGRTPRRQQAQSQPAPQPQATSFQQGMSMFGGPPPEGGTQVAPAGIGMFGGMPSSPPPEEESQSQPQRGPDPMAIFGVPTGGGGNPFAPAPAQDNGDSDEPARDPLFGMPLY